MKHPVKNFREENGLTLADLGATVGLSASQVSRIENWLLYPPIPTIVRFISATNGAVTANDFLPVVQSPTTSTECDAGSTAST